jgi:hypothetical protein
LSFSRNPQPGDLSLVVEISDSKLAFDLTVKAGLYERAGIIELWVLDINRRHLLVHRNPVAGRYSSVVVYNEDENITPLAAPGSEFCAAAVLPRVISQP